MRSRLLYVVPFLLTAGSAEAQMWGGWGPNVGPGPGSPYAMSPSYGGPDGDSMNTLYPVRRYVVRRTPVYVNPGPIIINNSRVHIDNNKRVYIRNKNTVVRRVYPAPRPVYIQPAPVYTINP